MRSFFMCWFCPLLAAVLAVGMIFVHSQFPRATIRLEPGPPSEFYFREPREITFLPDSHRLITCDWQQNPDDESVDPVHYRLRLWDVRTGRFIASLVEGPQAKVLAVSADSTRIAVDQSEGYVAVADAQTGHFLWASHAGDHDGFVFVNGELCTLSNQDLEIRELKTKRVARLWGCEVWDAWQNGQSHRPNRRLRIGQTFQLVDPTQNKIVAVVPAERIGKRMSWTLSANQRFLGLQSPSENGLGTSFAVTDLATEKEVRYETEAWLTNLSSLAPDGTTLAVHCDNGGGETPIRQWLIDWHIPLRRSDWSVTVYHLPTGRRIFVREAALFGVFAPDGRTLAILRDDNRIELWDWPNGTPWRRMLFGAFAPAAVTFGYTFWRSRQAGQSA